jgi:hypothetical protein
MSITVSSVVVGGPRPETGLTPRSVGILTVAGAAALGFVVAALYFGLGLGVVGIGPMLGSPLALDGLRHIPGGRVVALILPGLTYPSWLTGA